MKGTATIIKVDGTIEMHDYDGKVPDFKVLQGFVGGYIEMIPRFSTYQGKNCVAFCNEEGKLDGLEFNSAATQAWFQAMNVVSGGGDFLVGNVVVLTGDKEFMRAL